MSTISGTIITNGGLTGTITIGGGSAPVLETATVKSTNVEQIVTPEEGVDGFNEIVVQAVESEDTLNTLFNTPAGATPTPFEMSDDNAQHTCFGFLNGLNITLDSGVKSVETNAFDRVLALKSIFGSGVETIKESAFSHTINLNSASFSSCKTIQKNAFDSCYNLNTISFPAVETIGESAFWGSTFNNVDFPHCTTIGREALGEGGLLTCNLPVCVTLGDRVLHNFKGTTLRLPAVQTMGRQQFRDCENLTDLYLGYDGVVTVTREEEWDDWEMFPDRGPMTINVHVPAGQLASYQANAIWQAIVTASARDNVTIVFVGDYA